jgi:hypothetical protein
MNNRYTRIPRSVSEAAGKQGSGMQLIWNTFDITAGTPYFLAFIMR